MIVRARHPGYDPTVLPEVLQANASARPEDTREVQTLRTALGADIGDLSLLRAYPNLRVLEILYAPGLETLRGLEACPHLTTLSVRWCPRLREVSALSSLRQLVVLGLEGCPEVGSLDGLGEYPCLERLVLGSCRIQDVVGVSMPALRSVTLDSLHQLRTIAWLGETRHLLGVRMLDVPALDSLHGLEGCTQLTALQLHAAEARDDGDSALRDITALKGCDSLTRLALSGCTKLEDIQVLRKLHGLTEVYLTRSAVSDVSPLADLPNLTELGLVGCGQLRDVTALKGNAGLRQLYLDKSGVPVEQIRGRLRKVSKPSDGGDIGRKEFEAGVAAAVSH